MAVVFENRVVESCATLGTGNLVVSGADLGYSTFAEKVPVGSTIHYLCESVDAVGRPTGEFELGRGTYLNANTISRDTVVSSSNVGSLVNFTQSNKRLSLTVLAPASTLIRADWREALGAQVEPGVIGYTAASVPPPGWLKRNGAAVSRTVYAGLFGAIGTTYGTGNGTTTFNLPDDRGLVDRGWDDGRGYDPGRVFGSEQGDAIREISGGWSEFYGGISEASGYGAFIASAGTTGAAGNNISVNKASGMTFAASRQVPVASEVRVKSRAYLPIIKY